MVCDCHALLKATYLLTYLSSVNVSSFTCSFRNQIEVVGFELIPHPFYSPDLTNLFEYEEILKRTQIY